MNVTKLSFILVVFACGIQLESIAQKNYVEADGIIEYHNRIPLPGATLVLYEGSKEVAKKTTNEEGHYNFILEYNKEYILEISKDDLVTKRVKYITTMPAKAKGGWWIGIPINLYEVCPGIDASVFKDPVAVVQYDQRRKEYEADPEYDNRMRNRIRSFESKNDACLEGEFVKLVRNADEMAAQNHLEKARELFEKAATKRPWEPYPKEKLAELNTKLAKQDAKKNMYDQNIVVADKLFAEGNLIAAKSYYKRAAAVYPSESYPGEKIREIDSKINEKENQYQASLKNDYQHEQKLAEQQKTNAGYNKAISEANAQFAQRNFTEAKLKYETARNLKPNESYPQQKIDEINHLLQTAQKQENQQKAQEHKYREYLKNADELLNAEKYEEARKLYSDALTIKPEEQYPRLKLNHIDNVLQKQAELAKHKVKEEKYLKAVADGDGYLAIQEYALARQAFQLAVSIKPDASYPKLKLTEIDTLIVAENDRKQQEKEREQRFARFIQLADNYYNAGELDKAKDAYVKALENKPGENYPKVRIQNIDDRLQAERTAQQKRVKQEQQYTLAIEQADMALDNGEFTASRLHYLKALRIKPNDAYASSKLNEVENQLAALEEQKKADQKKKQQFDALISSADEHLSGARYENAIKTYQNALNIDPTSDYAKKRIAQINDILSKLAASNTIVQKESKKIRETSLPDLVFNNEEELEVYLFELKRKYPEGITLEVYEEEKKTIRRYIIVRSDEASEFREIQHYWGGRDYSKNDKPVTQQYFNQQTKRRTNEYYNVVEM